MKKLATLFIILAGTLSWGYTIAHAGTVLFPYGGGTGTSTAPVYGQVLVGNAGGTYTLTATSSLGIVSGGSGTVSTSTPGLSSGQPVYATGLSTIASVASSTFLASLGTIPIADGGTATSSENTNGVCYFDGTAIQCESLLTFSGTTFTINGTANTQIVQPVTDGTYALGALADRYNTVFAKTLNGGNTGALTLTNTSGTGVINFNPGNALQDEFTAAGALLVGTTTTNNVGQTKLASVASSTTDIANLFGAYNSTGANLFKISSVGNTTIAGTLTTTGLSTGTGNGALCMTTAGLVEYSAGANCVAGGSVTSVTGTWPIISSGGATPNITWGGLATSTAAVIGNIPYFSGVNTFANVATSSLAVGASISNSGTLGAQIGGTASSLSLNMANANSWTALQTFANASTTLGSFSYASSTLYYGAGLSSCAGATNALTWASGQFGCNTINGGVTGLVTPQGTATGAITLATSSSATTGLTIGLNIVGSTNTDTFNPVLSGTLNVANGGTGATSVGKLQLLATNSSGTVISTSTPTFANFNATSTTATSTIVNALTIAGTATTNGYLLIEGDNSQSPVYGTDLQTDQIDAGGKANALRSINTYNNQSGTCGQAGFVANGDIPTQSQDFSIFANTNSAWTGGAGCTDFTDPSNVNPLSTYLFQPTWDMDFVLGTTTNTIAGVPTGFKWLTASGATQDMVLTNQGYLGIATSTPFSPLEVTNNGAASQIVVSDNTAAANLHYDSLATADGNFTVNSLTDANATTTLESLSGGSTTLFGIGTTTSYAALGVLSSSNTNVAFAVSTTTGSDVFRIDAGGHVSSIGPDPVITSCGTSPSVVGDDNAFEITVGTVSATGCTATFARPWAAAPVCTVTNQSMSLTAALGYTISTTAVVVTQSTGLTGDKLDILCTGRI